MSATFAERWKAKQALKGKAPTPNWNSTGIGDDFALGEAHQAMRAKDVNEANGIDVNLPTLKGTIVSACQNKKIKDIFDVTMLTEEVVCPQVKANGLPSHIVTLPSGAIVQLGICKWRNPVKEMIASPHKFAQQAHAVQLNGLVVISIPSKNANNKVNNKHVKEFEIEHLLPSSFIEIRGVSFVYKTAQTQTCYVAGMGGGVSVETTSIYVNRRNDAIFNKFTMSQGLQLQMTRELARKTASPFPGVVTSARLDALALAAHIDKVVAAYEGKVAVVDDTRSVTLLDDDAKASLQTASARLKIAGDPARPIDTGSVASIGDEASFHHCFDYDARPRAHVVPILQNGVSPTMKREMETNKNGFGSTAFMLKHLFDASDASDPATRLTHASESVLAIAPEKLDRSIDDKRNKSIGAFAVDVSAVNICTRKPGDNDWDFFIPKLETGKAMSPAQLVYSAVRAAKFDAKNAFGFYDFFKLQMVFHELVPFANVAFFTSLDYNPVAMSSGLGYPGSVSQPGVASDFGGARPGEILQNIIDVPLAISTVGLRISEKFVKDMAVDEDGTVIAVDKFQQLGELKADLKDMHPPAPPKLDRDGYTPINSIGEVLYAPKLKKQPENTGSVAFFAVVEDCSKIENHKLANEDAAEGEAALLKMLGSKYPAMEPKDAIRDNVAIYAVAMEKEKKRPAPIAVAAASGGSDDEPEEEGSNKKNKMASDDSDAD